LNKEPPEEEPPFIPLDLRSQAVTLLDKLLPIKKELLKMKTITLLPLIKSRNLKPESTDSKQHAKKSKLRKLFLNKRLLNQSLLKLNKPVPST